MNSPGRLRTRLEPLAARPLEVARVRPVVGVVRDARSCPQMPGRTTSIAQKPIAIAADGADELRAGSC